VRFNTADTAYISFTPTLQGSRTTWTWSGWVKRSALPSSGYYSFFGADSGAGTSFYIAFDNSTQQIEFGQGATIYRKTTQVFRDPSAWYHIVLSLDTTQATANDRVKLYLNGTQITAFGTLNNPTQYAILACNNNVAHSIGADITNTGARNYFSGYLADINFVDGLALTPSSFTATDANTGQLVPAQYTGNRGTNGFYLPFSGAALAADLGQNPKTTGQDYPYWPYNMLLVDTTNTNGQQNNTFLDSSTNNFTVTRNGNTTQGNLSPFTFGGGTTQADGYYSGYFDGTGDFISIPSSAQLDLTGDFTIEMFFLMNNATSGGAQGFIANGANSFSGTATALIFGHSSGPTKLSFFAYNILTGTTPVLQSSTTISLGQWYHVAITRSGSTMRLFINGQQEASYSSSAIINLDTTLTKVGSYWGGDFNGYISSARVVKGTAVYTANFTVPTTPLTNITNTSLLTCQSSQFIDNSANAFAITVNGNARPAPNNPFGMTAWSGYFDGTGDYLTVANNAALDPNTDSFCMECWVYITGTTGNNQGFNGKGVAGTSGYSFYITNALLLSFVWNGTGGATITGGTLSLNTWNHVAVVRNSGVIRLYLNGVGAASSTACTTDINSTNGLFIGQARGANPILGNMSNYRMTKGTLPPGYDATATTLPVPTAPLTAISGTSLLTCQSSTFIDNSTNAFSINVFGNSYTGTLNNPFNSPVNSTPPVQGWSAYNPINSTFEQGNGYITLPTSTNLALGSGDFCVEFFVYSSVGYGMNNTFCGNFFGATAGAFHIDTSNNSGAVGPVSVRFSNSDGLLITSPVMLRLNQWFHIVVCRTAGTLSMFINGNRVGSVANTYNFSNGTGMEIFRGNTNANARASGYMSNFRIVKGTSPYNAGLTTLTVPTEPLQAITGTQLLALQSNQLVDNSPNRFPLTLVTIASPGITPASVNSPFLPTTAYSAASYGGSMYFDGTGDYLTVPSNAALELGTGDFTIEGWVYIGSGIVDNAGIVSKRSLSTFLTGNWRIAYRTGTGKITFADDSVNERGTPVVGINRWVHFAFSRKSGTIRAFADGVLGDTAADTVNLDNNETVYIGANTTSILFLGYISGLRILKGTALYTTPFVPPVLPPTAVTNTSLLLNATNSGIYDATGKNVIETVGNAQVSTAVKKFGESSMYFDGSGDYLVIPPKPELYLSTNQQLSYTNKDFTIECWIYPTTIAYPNSYAAIAVKRGSTAAATGYIFSVTSAGALNFFAGDANTAGWELSLTSSGGLIAANNWYHVAVTRQGATFRSFINGVQVATSSPSAFLIAYDITAPLFIGLNTGESPAYPWYGYMQDFRYTIGAARYQGAFTPPAAAFAYNQYDIGNQQWLPTNISVTAGVGQDNLFDSPSDYGTDTGLGGQVRGNYATLNAVDSGRTLSNGSLEYAGAASGIVKGTFAVSSGKWYWECQRTGAGNSGLGICTIQTPPTTLYLGGTSGSYGYYSNGTLYNNGNAVSYGASYTTSDIIGVALDLDAGTLVFYKNGVSQGTAVSGLSGTFTAAAGNNTTTDAGIFNFGQRAFAYAAPSGFKCLVSTNLPTPTIGATSTTQANDYFNANTWTGNGAQIPVGFDPSLLWYKSTNAVSFGGWIDQIRGDNYYMLTYSTAASTLISGLLTTNSTGFVPGSDFSTNTYVAYSWRGADTLSWSFDGSLERTATMTIASPCVVTLASNGFSPGQAVRFTTTGALPTGIVAGTTYYAGNMVGSTFNLYDTEANAITGGATGRVDTSGSQSGTQTCEHAARISANPTSGFSVTQYIGVGGTTTVPHGLGAAPEMYIIKCASTTGNWLVFTTALDGSVDYAYLNGQQNLTNAGPGFSTLPTSTVVSLGTDPDANTNGVTYMLYSYVSIPGFSKVGVYTGNGAADGPMIYTNFSPEMMLLKRVSGTPIDNWYNLDVPRSPYNVVSNYLIPNSSAAQASATFVDFLSNGFKVRAAGAYENAAGSSYLYLAIASAPFKYSRAY
jgi:hypothetical protein